MSLRTVITALVLALPAPAFATPPELGLPLDCTLGQDCFIQQYTDLDPSEGARDFTCGPLSYDGHKGTDFRLVFRQQILGAGVAVLAAADGRIRAVRDTSPDIAVDDPLAPDVTGVECGNGVVIDHADGWRTQYCHMRLGSIRVRPGEKIARGDVLGLVGLSGNTQFPHVHLQLSKDGSIVDPFHPGTLTTCGDETENLFVPAIAYSPGGLMAAGFATSAIGFDEVRNGPAKIETLPTDAAAITFWGYFFGLRKGDRIEMSIRQPDGSILVEQTYEVERPRAVAYRLTGKKRSRAGWQPGFYTGQVNLRRDRVEIDRRIVPLTVR